MSKIIKKIRNAINVIASEKGDPKKIKIADKKIKAKKIAIKPETIKDKAKIVKIADFFQIVIKTIENVKYALCVNKKSDEHTRPFSLVSLDNMIARKETKSIDPIMEFMGYDLAELNNTIFSDVKRIGKGSYKINPIYSAVLYPLFYRYENRIAQKLDANNYLRMINRFISAELYSLVSADFDLKDQAEKNHFTLSDPSTGMLSFQIKK